MDELGAYLDGLSPFSRICALALMIFAVISIMAPYFNLNSLRGIHDELERIRKELEKRGKHIECDMCHKCDAPCDWPDFREDEKSNDTDQL